MKFTKNIGMSFFTSDKPVWYTLCDVIASKLLNDGKVPCIEKAYRMVPHGQQKGNLAREQVSDNLNVFPPRVIDPLLDLHVGRRTCGGIRCQ